MVDIFVFSIAGITYICTVLHDDGLALEVVHDIALTVASIGVFGILIYTVIAESVERTDSNTGFKTLSVRTVGERESLL